MEYGFLANRLTVAVLIPAGLAHSAPSTPATQQQPACTARVVPCNYAHLYSGRFSWTSTLHGPASTYTEQAQVDITNGKAVCNGGATSVDHGNSRTGSMTGDGLVAVEFEKDDSTGRPIYHISVACPSIGWPATADAAATPQQPASMDHNSQSTYNQPSTAIGQALLRGQISNPSPDADPLNGVTGTISISWSLTRP